MAEPATQSESALAGVTFEGNDLTFEGGSGHCKRRRVENTAIEASEQN